MCHGPTGQEGPDDRLAGGQGSLAGDQPRKTVGSYWPAATTLWDYVNRAMPFNQPGSLSADEVYGVVAYVLYLNDLVGEQDPVDADTLPRNRDAEPRRFRRRSPSGYRRSVVPPVVIRENLSVPAWLPSRREVALMTLLPVGTTLGLDSESLLPWRASR